MELNMAQKFIEYLESYGFYNPSIKVWFDAKCNCWRAKHIEPTIINHFKYNNYVEVFEYQKSEAV